jgi:hypothetical protein
MPEGDKKMAKWKRAAYVVYQCSYHLVWTPKYRYRMDIAGDIQEYVDKKIRAICDMEVCKILGRHRAAGRRPRTTNLPLL